ncbi:MAG: amidohydrolase family protein [Alphaproteobacteria bacterium]|nr:amidohydrolase family protein [Alphaproteobacteria bacterium]
MNARSAKEVVFRGGRLADGRLVDLTVRDGVVHVVQAAIPSSPDDEDLCGLLLLPALVDGHVHLDKTFLGLPWRSHRAGPTVRHRIEAEKAGRGDLGLSVERRALNFLDRALSRGTVALRSHVDIDPACKLDHLHGVMAAREARRGRIDVQLVAFPQSGLLTAPGVSDLLDAALREGVELVGGIDPIGVDGDLDGHLDAVFGLAERHGVGVDIHLHDPGYQGALELRAIAERTRVLGLGGRVTVSHAFALATIDAKTLAITAEALAVAGVTILTNGPGPTPLIPIETLRAAGVAVAAGSDNVRDAWSPFGNADMLERAMLIAYRAGFRTDEGLATALALATTASATMMGRPSHGLAVGHVADFIAVDAETPAEAVVDRPPRALVVKAGRVVARDGSLVRENVSA